VYSRLKDIQRRIQHLLAADISNLKDEILDRAKEIAAETLTEGSPQEVAVAAYESAKREYLEALTLTSLPPSAAKTGGGTPASSKSRPRR
jgi:hypothetical protein